MWRGGTTQAGDVLQILALLHLQQLMRRQQLLLCCVLRLLCLVALTIQHLQIAGGRGTNEERFVRDRRTAATQRIESCRSRRVVSTALNVCLFGIHVFINDADRVLFVDRPRRFRIGAISLFGGPFHRLQKLVFMQHALTVREFVQISDFFVEVSSRPTGL